MRIRLGFGGIFKGLASHLGKKLSFDLAEIGYGDYEVKDSDERAALEIDTATNEIANLVLPNVSQATCSEPESNPILVWMGQEHARLTGFGLTHEDAGLALNTVIAGDRSECESILRQIPSVPRFHIRMARRITNLEQTPRRKF